MNLITKSIRVDSDELKRFERLYPGLLSIFIRKAITCCLNDKSLFDKIFFSNIK